MLLLSGGVGSERAPPPTFITHLTLIGLEWHFMWRTEGPGGSISPCAACTFPCCGASADTNPQLQSNMNFYSQTAETHQAGNPLTVGGWKRPKCSDPDCVGVRVGDVSDPALRRAGLDGRQAQEADLQPRGGDLRQLEAQAHRTDLQHGGRAEAGHLQLKTGGGGGC